jgi:hypothetical protein
MCICLVSACGVGFILHFQMRWDPNKPPPTVHEFDKKLVEADAYLQILIDQIKVRILCIC